MAFTLCARSIRTMRVRILLAHTVDYTGELQTYRYNLKWIRILNSLYSKIRVNKNSYRFEIIKLQQWLKKTSKISNFGLFTFTQMNKKSN